MKIFLGVVWVVGLSIAYGLIGFVVGVVASAVIVKKRRSIAIPG